MKQPTAFSGTGWGSVSQTAPPLGQMRGREMRFLTVKNWETFQHFKEKYPRWIKLHVSLWDDFAYRSLPDSNKMMLIWMWIFAARHDNKIPAEQAWLQKTFGKRKVRNINKLIDLGWLIIVDETGIPIATPERAGTRNARTDRPSTDTAGEKRREEKKTNCNPPLRGAGELTAPIVSWSTRDIPSDLLESLPRLPACDNSETFKHSVGNLLRSLGFEINYEVTISIDPNGKKGRLDIVACRKNEVIGIECDRVTDRRKSIRNLKQFGQPGMIILREPNVVTTKTKIEEKG